MVEFPLVAQGNISDEQCEEGVTTSRQNVSADESRGLSPQHGEGSLNVKGKAAMDVPAEGISLAEWMGGLASPRAETSSFRSGSVVEIKDANTAKEESHGEEYAGLVEVYEYFRVEKLLSELPAQGEGNIWKPQIVFYSHCQKEMEVTHDAIRGLKRLKSRLGNDVVDFVMSRVYLTYSGKQRHEIHIVSSRISTHR